MHKYSTKKSLINVLIYPLHANITVHDICQCALAFIAVVDGHVCPF